MVHSSARTPNPPCQCVIESLQLPVAIQPYRRALVPGPGVSVYCDQQRPNEWPEHQHEAAQVLFALESAACDISWRAPGGEIPLIVKRSDFSSDFILKWSGR